MVDIRKIRHAFKERFGAEGEIFCAPGRVNLIGEHTDYNMGFVLPGAIDKAITLAIRPNGLNQFRLLALDTGEEETFTVADKSTRHHWASYILGVVMEFQSRCFAVPPFDAVFAGDIPQGGAMSSSAALESAFAFAINELGNFGVQRLELAQIGQSAEHKYAGVRCGIMDQFASLHGAKDHLIRLDCRSLQYELIPFVLPGYRLLLLDTRVKHSLASSEYNTRRAECETGVAILRKRFNSVQSLRDADLAMLESVRAELDQATYTRCQYVIEENDRVLAAVEQLKLGDVAAFGRLMYASHEGLSQKYNVSCRELDLLVAVARETQGVQGARMMGGGFGGCTINLVAESAIADFKRIAQEKFFAAFGHNPLVYEVAISEGARRP
ncbi:MAG: galactokinase [Turneriella sp.]